MCYYVYMALTIFSLLVLVFSVVVHEISHGTAAYYLGDSTAKDAGRLTLNPLAHLDLFGSVLLPLLLLLFTAGKGPVLGWAKPVPINPYNFKNPRWDNVKVALAGPGSNLVLAVFFGLVIRFLPLPLSLMMAFAIIVLVNLLLALFNLVPLPPLDGSYLLFGFLPEKAQNIKIFLAHYGVVFLVLFIFFGLNLIFSLVSFLYFLLIGQPAVLGS
jgi:Zn-dependent protease